MSEFGERYRDTIEAGARNAYENAHRVERWSGTIIANVSGGDWSQQSEEWCAAAERWRDQFHRLLDAARALPTNGDE